jgi:hypothetical protein
MQNSHSKARGLTMREAIDAGKYYHVAVPGWACGGHDVVADTPAEAALLVGCWHAYHLGGRGVGIRTEVLRHLPGSRIGAVVLESCGVFETLTADHYAI